MEPSIGLDKAQMHELVLLSRTFPNPGLTCHQVMQDSKKAFLSRTFSETGVETLTCHRDSEIAILEEYIVSRNVHTITVCLSGYAFQNCA